MVILLLPQPLIWRLRVSKNRRIGVSLVFCIGIISVGAAIGRTVLAYIYAESADVTWNFSQVGIFILLEMTAAILVFAVPTAPKPSAHLAKRAGSSLVSLIRPNRSGSGSSGHGPFATGSENTQERIYRDLEGGIVPPLPKPRLARSKHSADADSQAELTAPSPTR
ncbi:hypothetical protein BU24DRAFT_349527 [Aaosphaeria arxii CBS 175.79]|uniref:Rhodopsin domain-containing protein n=1 Tax=Aaosphaeria arxii CBS 175.79 TaxID=1450172 RepID=A0A6A5XJK9_9PLEO|nr:uncharacterized protein BU24DRAFT_349527 [Aaosphaeria arxii CBS 175.79]KAF2013465.1 hypothetical protein BU24DRAFT_349527 [Aaosphaeria arxii CBS 175.79]